MTASDLALQPPPIHFTIGPDRADGARLFQGIPSIERAENGRLWAVWYTGGTGEGPDNYVVAVTSGDDGATWSPLKLAIDPPEDVRAFDPEVWVDPTGRMWLFWAQGYSWWDGRAGVWAITTDDPDDEDATWSEPRRLCNGIMMCKPTVLTSGEWLLPAAVWGREPNSTGEGKQFDLGDEIGGNVVCSTDEGQTWEYRGGAQVPQRVFDEHMVIEHQDGRLSVFVRTEYGVGESVSTDRGRTWSPGRPSNIPNVNSRPFVRRLQSGAMLAVTHLPPDGKTRSHLMAHLSTDDGATWTGGLMIDERKAVSYPDGVQAPDGTIYVIYDYQRTDAKQFLMATFTEQDVATGSDVSGAVRRRVVVNQATAQKRDE